MAKTLLLLALTLAAAGAAYATLDLSLARYFHAWDDTPVEGALKNLTKLGESQCWLILGLALFFLLRKKEVFLSRLGLLMFSGVAVSGILVNMVKALVGRARPELLLEEGFAGWTGWAHPGESLYSSFPSGHTATAFAVATTLALAVPRYRGWFYFGAAAIGFSRVGLTAHYLSDVIVGAFFGYAVTRHLAPRILETHAR